MNDNVILKESDILALLSEGPATKNDLARRLKLKGAQRIALKTILKKLANSGEIEKGKQRMYKLPHALPKILMVHVEEILPDGTLSARPVSKDYEVYIHISPNDKKAGELVVTAQALVELGPKKDTGVHSAKVLKVLAAAESERVVGVVRHWGKEMVLVPVNRKDRNTYRLENQQSFTLKDEDLVIADVKLHNGLRKDIATIQEVICNADDPHAISMISIAEQDIPFTFPNEVIEEAEALKPPTIKGREDLRAIPLVTIDGADARDFDDAVFAEPDGDGWHLLVAIADVSYYVRERSLLDKEAFKRGNSCYFPDRVVPMLPERLSNDLCSLRPNEDRACLAVHMWIDSSGQIKSYKFVRGLMRSQARLTYDQVHAEPEKFPHLYGAFNTLKKARHKRGTLDLHVPEHQIIFNGEGEIEQIRLRQSLPSHQLIEEFMILANVCAAEALLKKNYACVFRVHDVPSPEKLEDLHIFLKDLDYSLPKGQAVKPHMFMSILEKSTGTREERLIHQMILRSQAQARYDVQNIGHFGLALSYYAHFTSPIRRYADLLVHRGLISALGLGDDGFEETDILKLTSHLSRQAEHISFTERRAIQAERQSTSRYLAKFMENQEGAQFAAAISGVTRFGLFVVLQETGAEGFVPARLLTSDYYTLDERRKALVGRRHGHVYQMGDAVLARLETVEVLSGSLTFSLVESLSGGDTRRPPKPRDFRRNRDEKRGEKRGENRAKPFEKRDKGPKQGEKGGSKGGKPKKFRGKSHRS